MTKSKAIKVINRRIKHLMDRLEQDPSLSFDAQEKSALNLAVKMIEREILRDLEKENSKKIQSPTFELNELGAEAGDTVLIEMGK